MPTDDQTKPDDKPVNETAAAKPAETKPDPAPEPDGTSKPLPHEIAKALDNDVMLMLDAVVHAATDDTLRRCPSLASICQAYQINRQSMIDWLERVKFREEQREERRKEAADDKEA